MQSRFWPSAEARPTGVAVDKCHVVAQGFSVTLLLCPITQLLLCQVVFQTPSWCWDTPWKQLASVSHCSLTSWLHHVALLKLPFPPCFIGPTLSALWQPEGQCWCRLQGTNAIAALQYCSNWSFVHLAKKSICRCSLLEGARGAKTLMAVKSFINPVQSHPHLSLLLDIQYTATG